LVDKAEGGVGYVEEHQNPVDFLEKDNIGIGKFGAVAT
jgi:hypothetical protein